MRYINYLFIAFLIFNTPVASFAQAGEIKGQVVDKKTKDPIPFATVTAESKGMVVAGAQTDIDGDYAIKPLTPGRYDVKAVYYRYQHAQVKDVLVREDKPAEVKFEMVIDSLKQDLIIR